MTRRTLGSRFAWWVLLYTGAMAALVLYHGYLFNEGAERVVWETMLEFDLDRLVRENAEPGTLEGSSSAMRLYRADGPGSMPAVLDGLGLGVHDDVAIDGRDNVVLVKDIAGERWHLALDIASLERDEDRRVGLLTMGSMAVGLLLVLGAWFLARRLSGPLAALAQSFRRLSPDAPSQRLQTSRHATVEEATIAGAMNEYLERQERFVQREREFVDMVSHELRTPMAVISGAADVIAEHSAMSPQLEPALRRIRQTADDVTHLISLLLVLAKDPKRLADASEPAELQQLIPEIIEDHLHLAVGKDLVVRAGSIAPCTVAAPPQLLKVAVGNLLRNAIENSDRGVIVIEAPTPGVVRIQDPGHGMTPEEIGSLYASVARGGQGRVGHGIGLELIARLCEHLGWRVQVEALARGTIATLDARQSLVGRG